MISVRLRLAGYGATVFAASALLMVLEIVAARLLAPYVGVSLYTWTSIIGVILAGLSLGNWVGGVWADRGATGTSAGFTLLASALASVAILLLLTWLAPLLQARSWGLLSTTFVYVVSLFFVPATLLGIVTPLLTTLALRADARAGHVVGRMQALAALGSITGTFAAGYWLIQYFGTRAVVMGCAAALLLLALPYLRAAARLPAGALLLAGIALAGWTYARGGYLNPCERESQYYCIRVVDATAEVPFGRARAMILDHLMHSVNHESHPQVLVSPYVHLMDELTRRHFDGREPALRYFFAGGGAYTHPRAVRAARPDAHVSVAEVDPAVTAVASERMWLDRSGLVIRHEDARMVLERTADGSFDVVVGDVFHDLAVPYHLATQEYVQLVRRRLRSDGLYMINVVDRYPDPLLVKAMYKTLSSVFEQVRIWLPQDVPMPRATYVIEAGTALRRGRLVKSSQGFPRRWEEVTVSLLEAGTPLLKLPLLTDDFVPLDRLVRSAVLAPSH